MLKRFDVWLQQLEFTKNIHGIAIGIAVLLLVLAGVLAPTTNALSISSGRDCDENAVIKCGALTINELKEKYASSQGAAAIFSHFGISSQDISNLTNGTTVEGKVTKGGRVVVDGKTVATGAMTAGRQNMSGSTATTRNGVTFYVRSPDASFQSASLKAFVVLDKDGQFVFAVIASCGNPVKATPVKKEKPPEQPKPTPPAPTPPQPQPETPQPPAPQPTPPPAAPQQQQQQQQNSSSSATANVTINNEKTEQPTPPAPQPQPEIPPQPTVIEKVEVPPPAPTVEAAPTATAPVTQELPKTGMESVSSTLSIVGLTTLAGTIAHMLYTRRKATR